MPRLLSQANFSNITVASLTTTSTSQVALDVFSKTSFRSVKYQIQVTQGSSYHTTEFIIVHNGSLTFNTEFAIVKTGDSLATFDSDISSNNVRLLITPASSSSTTFKAIRTSINT
jgi:hypothetical protein